MTTCFQTTEITGVKSVSALPSNSIEAYRKPYGAGLLVSSLSAEEKYGRQRLGGGLAGYEVHRYLTPAGLSYRPLY